MSDLRVETGRGWTMYLGDCVEVMSTLNPVDHVITDPPYEAQAHAKQRRVRSRVDGAAFARGKRIAGPATEVVPIDFAPIDEATRGACAVHWARLARRWVVVFCTSEGLHPWMAAGEAAGLRHMRQGVWVKPDGMPQLTGDRPGVGIEAIEILHAKGRSRWNGGGKRAVWTHCTRWRPENGGASYRRGGREGADDLLTTKPPALMLDLVRDFTDAGETILDPFAGSATTGVAALRIGRRFVGVERDPKYFALAVERLRAEEGGTTLAASRAQRLPMWGSR